ncbi:MAG TPA: Fe-S protein assembly chaperone HscA [Saprospiraceae bacterium]|nr:Fe-S protein assembly chaperone HscA [Saprospiraceae bacterium]
MSKIAIDFKTGQIKNTAQLVVGIDLGTTNSLIARINDGRAEIIKDFQNKPLFIPSVINVGHDGVITVGHEAIQKLITDPESTVYSIKRLMGKSLQDFSDRKEFFGYHFDESASEGLIRIRLNDRYYTPVELSSYILRHLVQEAEKALGVKIEDAVITVPAYFNDEQRQATRDAGKIAGLNVLRIVNEPTAASLAYGLGQNKTEALNIAVYDLGGGTFDVSILRIEDGVFDVLATRGDTNLGGDDFDREIIKFWKEKYQLYPENPIEQSELFFKARAAKHELSDSNNFSTTWNHHILSLSNEEYKTLSQPYIDRTLDCFRLALSDSGLHIHDIDELLLVGGSTRMPIVFDALQSFYGKTPNRSLHPDEAVALGAAIQADILAGNRKDFLLLDVNPLSLGIETLGGIMDVIIPRNSKIPIQQAREYTTSRDGQKNLKIAIYQGERDLVENNKLLAGFILEDIPPMPAGIPKIQVRFMIDADGILTVKAIEQRTQTEQSITIKSQFNISAAEVASMLQESIRFAKSDQEKKALIDSINEGKYLQLASEKFLKNNHQYLTSLQRSEISNLITYLKDALDSKIRDHIELAIEALNKYTAPIAHKALDRNIADALRNKNISEAINNETKKDG